MEHTARYGEPPSNRSDAAAHPGAHDLVFMQGDSVDKNESYSPAARHFTPAEISDLWKIHVETVRRMFAGEPGVIVIQAPARRGKRGYRTLRIPAGVLDRVHRRLQTR